MGQAIKTTGDTGKTYSLVSWLPSVRVSGDARPHSKVSEDGVMIALAGFTLFALFMSEECTGWLTPVMFATNLEAQLYRGYDAFNEALRKRVEETV